MMEPLSKKYSKNRRCPTCSRRITNANSIGMCKPCWLRVQNTDPEFRRKVGEGQRRKLREDSTAYAKKCAILAENRAKARARPEWAEIHARSFAALLAARTPETEARRIAALIAANKRRRHAWLPDELREDHRKMIRNSRIPAAEAKQIILGQIEAEQKRERLRIANLSPFERQERALAQGARIVANDQKPSLANPGIYRAGEAA